MTRAPRAHAALACLVLAVLPALGFGQEVSAPKKAAAGANQNTGQFFEPIVEPIRQDATKSLRASALAYLERATAEGNRPILVFEFHPGAIEPGGSSFGAAIELADFLARDLGGAKQTVAYVPEPLSGFAVLPVLACGEIVLGPEASLGPIGLEGRAISNREREAVRQLAAEKGRDADLLLGLLEPNRDLRQVRTADGRTHFVLAENLKDFRTNHQVLEETPAWEGRRGVLTASKARQTIAKLEAEDRAKIAVVYGLPSTAIDPTLIGEAKPVLIPVHGLIDAGAESFLLRQIYRAKESGANLIFFEFDSEGGVFGPADKLAMEIAQLEGIKTIAYIKDRALGVAALLPLACDQIVFRHDARMGDVRRQVVDADGDSAELDEGMTRVLADRAEELARLKGHPGAIARAMVEPDAVVLRVRDKQVGAVVFALAPRVQADAQRFEVLGTVKPDDGRALTITAETAPELQMSSRVVKDFNELQNAMNLSGKVVRQATRTWVDSLVDTLNDPWLRGVLLFIGFFMLVLELKLPGIGLPALLSTLAFLLYFWSGYLGGTADMLEVLLFIVGLICIGLELFVFPGLGIFGMSGVLLVLVSVVMASHTFVWPTQDYEFRQLTGTVFRVLGVIVGTIVAIVIVGRFFPSLPIFNRLILKPEPAGGAMLEPGQKPAPDPDAPYTFLLGEVGRTTTPLRPSGKARFGELLVDVTADGFWIEANQPVEVAEVHGSRIVVKRT